MSYFDKPKHYIYMIQAVGFEASLSPALPILTHTTPKVRFGLIILGSRVRIAWHGTLTRLGKFDTKGQKSTAFDITAPGL